MAQELIYTSAPRGLLPGSSGFCTVARTVGMSPVLVGLLESRSGYRHLFPPQSEKASLNPVNWSHGTVRSGQTQLHILSRIADAGLDYTKRSNVIAHHLVLGPNELSPCGPAALLAEPDLMRTQWELSPTEFPTGHPIPNPPTRSLKCVHWEQIRGDAGWGGVLAESVLQSRSACILFEPGTDLLPLFAESIALLPESLRWKVSFSTYLRETPTGGTFLWKGLLAGTPEAEQAKSNKGNLLIDLTAIGLESPPNESSFVKIARTGVAVPPQKEKPREAVPPPPISPVPSRSEQVEVPAIQGDTYEIIDTPLRKRKRPHVGPWSSRYDSQAVSVEKERKARRIFFTIIGLTSLVILVLLTLLCDELFNSGQMRKGVSQSFGSLFRSTAKTPDPDQPPPVKPDEPPAEPPKNEEPESEAEQTDVPAAEPVPEPEPQPTEEELEAQRLQEEEARKKEEEEQAEKLRRQKEAEEQREKQKEDMRQAFAAIPELFPLAEPKIKAFGGIELPHTILKEFSPLFPYKDYLQMQWMPLIAPKGWRYHLEKVPQVFLDDPHAQWNLIAHLQEGEAESTPRAQKSLTLATLSLGENGLDIEWKSQTAGLDSNLEIVNKLPFSYLRMSFGPNAATEGGPGKERKTLPIPKRFDAKNDVATIDFLESTWFKDVALWSPSTNKPFVFSEKGEINRPANPTEKFENVFGKDRFRVGLEQIDLADALSLEVFVTPDLGKNMTAIVEETDSPRKKTVSVTVDSVGEKKTTVVIPIAVEVFPDRIEFRDVSQDLQSEAIKSRTALTKTIKEKNEALAGAKLETFQTSNTGEKVGEKEAQNAFDLYKRSLQREIDEAKRKQTQANEQFVAIPLARKQLFGVEMRIRYSVYLQGGDSTEKMLILTTSGGEPPR